MRNDRPQIVIVGAGIGGLAASVRLAALGCAVTVLEGAGHLGGKMRTVESPAGPVDAGPTVLTMTAVFEELFAAAGVRLADHVTLRPLDVLARHYWRDGTRFDLFADPEATRTETERVFGARTAQELRRWQDRADRLLDAFDAPMMRAARPSTARLAATVAANPRLLADMAPWRSLASDAFSALSEPKLAQLMARYATYVGGSPWQVPALLALISASEARGVSAVDGGMAALAGAVADLARSLGVEFRTNCPVERISQTPGGMIAHTPRGDVRGTAVVFNGDPRALATGLLGEDVTRAVPPSSVEPRSLSAHVLAFAARPSGPALQHHTVFFGDDPRAEFATLERGEVPEDATLYLCAQDHGQVPKSALQRFEVIRNAPPVSGEGKEVESCQRRIMERFAEFGLAFDPQPGREAMTAPADWARAFPGSLGSLYGRSPSGLTAGLKRPTARTRVPGLYLVGGGAHPGAGVPMAALSARHLAETMARDLGLTSTCPRTATLGGMSTA